MLFETQPNMKRTFRQYRGKKHSELRINEDLQCTIMYLMSILKRLVTNIIILTKLQKYILLLLMHWLNYVLPIFQVRYINDNRATVKYMRRLAKKHSPLELDLGRIDPNEVATLFCTAIRDVKQICKDQVRKRFV